MCLSDAALTNDLTIFGLPLGKLAWLLHWDLRQQVDWLLWGQDATLSWWWGQLWQLLCLPLYTTPTQGRWGGREEKELVSWSIYNAKLAVSPWSPYNSILISQVAVSFVYTVKASIYMEYMNRLHGQWSWKFAVQDPSRIISLLLKKVSLHKIQDP